MARFWAILVAAWISLCPLAADQVTVNKLFEEGNEHYKNQNFEEAITKYRHLIDSLKVVNYALWYNLGNSYFRTGCLGRAIAAFERAYALAPRDRDIISNLEFARFRTKDKIPAKRPFIVIRWVNELYRSFSLNELVWTTELVYVLAAALVCLILLRRDLYGRLKYPLLVILVVLAVSGGLLATKLYQVKYTRQAVILDPKADIYSGPGENYTLRFILHEGTKLQVLKRNEGWYLIRLENDERGWIRQEGVEIL